MEPTEIVEWCLKVVWYLLILIGIGGNLALFKKFSSEKNQRLLFNWPFLASNQAILAILISMEKDDLYGTTGKGLKLTYRAMIYMEKICFSASVLTTLVLAIERFLVCRKFNTNNCNFKRILLSIGNVFNFYSFLMSLKI